MALVREKRTKCGLTIHQIWAELAHQYSPMFVFWFFHRPVIIVTDAQLVKEVLITKNLPRDKFGYSHFASLFGERMLGQGLLSEVSEDEWHWKRATLDPGFRRPSMMGMMDSFNTICDSFLQRLEALADGKTEVSMAEELVRINLDVIAKVFFKVLPTSPPIGHPRWVTSYSAYFVRVLIIFRGGTKGFGGGSHFLWQ